MPLLPRGAGVPPGETPQRRRAAGDRRPDGGQRRAPRGAGRGVRVGLSVDRRALEDRRGKWSRALDLVAARRQPDRRSRGGARAGRPPDAHDGAGGRDGAAATRDPQADHRRPAHDRVRSGPGPRYPQPQVLLHDRPADRDERGRRGDPSSGRTDARASARARPVGPAVRPSDALDLVLRAQAVDAVPVGRVRRRRVARGQARDHQARRAAPAQRARAAREPARGGAAGAAGARRPAGRGFPGAGGLVRRRLAARAPRVGWRRRLLRDPRALHRRAAAVGSLRRWRQEGRSPARVGADAGRGRPGGRSGRGECGRSGRGECGRSGRGGRARGGSMRVEDTFARPLRNLRISVTDRCNLRCAYCMPEEEYVWLPREQILHFEEMGALGRVGFGGTKLDTVVMRSVNDDELADLIEYGRSVSAEVRFIEYMDVGGATRWSMDRVVSRAEMLEVLGRRYGTIEPIVETSSAPADRHRLADGPLLGIISSTTAPFCASCDRSRLTADGMWYLCLYAQRGIDLRGPLRGAATADDLKALIASAWTRRADRGAEERLKLRERTPLVQIGRLREDPHLEMHTRGG